MALLTVGGVTGLYSIDLVTGAATLVGNFLGGLPATGLAIQNDLGGIPAIAISDDGLSLIRFNTATPGTTTSVALSPLPGGETLVAIDFRPQTGQLFGLGVNAATNTGTLYLMSAAQGGHVTVGAAGSIAFVDAAGNPVDLPSGGYGMDFDPTTDRIGIADRFRA